ncbi:hypothetical protein HanIR_Chr11g0513401 [Helianthus annuus]|nr:hypothetical protein HanIR_Chr11g0513401 [Helianthus annuus]
MFNAQFRGTVGSVPRFDLQCSMLSSEVMLAQFRVFKTTTAPSFKTVFRVSSFKTVLRILQQSSEFLKQLRVF